MKIARVAVDVPLDTLFDYSADTQPSDIGHFAVVPFGAKNTTGVIVEVVEHSDVLVAVWDGDRSRGEGGTADIVAYAADRGHLLLWVRASRG